MRQQNSIAAANQKNQVMILQMALQNKKLAQDQLKKTINTPQQQKTGVKEKNEEINLYKSSKTLNDPNKIMAQLRELTGEVQKLQQLNEEQNQRILTLQQVYSEEQKKNENLQNQLFRQAPQISDRQSYLSIKNAFQNTDHTSTIQSMLKSFKSSKNYQDGISVDENQKRLKILELKIKKQNIQLEHERKLRVCLCKQVQDYQDKYNVVKEELQNTNQMLSKCQQQIDFENQNMTIKKNNIKQDTSSRGGGKNKIIDMYQLQNFEDISSYQKSNRSRAYEIKSLGQSRRLLATKSLDLKNFSTKQYGYKLRHTTLFCSDDSDGQYEPQAGYQTFRRNDERAMVPASSGKTNRSTFGDEPIQSNRNFIQRDPEDFQGEGYTIIGKSNSNRPSLVQKSLQGMKNILKKAQEQIRASQEGFSNATRALSPRGRESGLIDPNTLKLEFARLDSDKLSIEEREQEMPRHRQIVAGDDRFASQDVIDEVTSNPLDDTF